MRRAPRILASLCFAVLAISAAQAQEPRKVKVDYKETTLKNGLRVITVGDHSAPVVAISVNYNVGSRDERKGRTGSPTFFEHMMFQGSENIGKSEHMALVFNNGGNMNGTTNEDRTVYFEVLPANQLRPHALSRSGSHAQFGDHQRQSRQSTQRRPGRTPAGCRQPALRQER